MVPFDVPDDLVEDSLQVNGTTLHYRCWGRGPPLYLIHGGPGGSGTYWPHALPYLGHHHTVYAFDLRGHGQSDRTPPYTITRFAADLVAAARALGHVRYTLLGHSFGSLVAMAAATDNRRVTHLILVGGFPYTMRMLAHPRGITTKLRLGARLFAWNLRRRRGNAPPIRDMLQALLHDARPLLHGHGGDAERIDRILSASVLDPLDAVVPLQRDLLRWDHRTHLGRIAAPTLVVVGSRDALAVPAARAMAREIPNAECVKIDDAAHSPFFEQPAEFRSVVERFLDADRPAQTSLGRRPASRASTQPNRSLPQ